MTTTAQDRPTEVVDRTALRFNQAMIVGLTLLAFVFNQAWLAAFTAIVMALGTITPQAALFQRIYRDVLRPAGWLRPDVQAESAAPHRFAQGMGAGVLGVGSLLLFLGVTTIGWALTLLVTALAAVNLAVGFCAGCFVYFQLQRLRARG